MLLEIQDINVRYGGATVLNSISINVKDGEIMTIIGNNGAGKTTILRTLSGLQRPESGEICFQGKYIHKTPAQDIVKMGIGHVLQGRYLFPFKFSMNYILLSYLV